MSDWQRGAVVREIFQHYTGIVRAKKYHFRIVLIFISARCDLRENNGRRGRSRKIRNREETDKKFVLFVDQRAEGQGDWWNAS